MSQLSGKEEENINNHLHTLHRMALPMKKIRINEVKKSYNIKSIQKSLRATTWSPEKYLKNFSRKVSER